MTVKKSFKCVISEISKVEMLAEVSLSGFSESFRRGDWFKDFWRPKFNWYWDFLLRVSDCLKESWPLFWRERGGGAKLFKEN